MLKGILEAIMAVFHRFWSNENTYKGISESRVAFVTTEIVVR